MHFKLIDTNRYALPGTQDRFLHMATVQYGLQEFICFADTQTSLIYIESITGGHLERIEDDQLAEALADFLRDKEILSIAKPLLKDDTWLRKPKAT